MKTLGYPWVIHGHLRSGVVNSRIMSSSHVFQIYFCLFFFFLIADGHRKNCHLCDGAEVQKLGHDDLCRVMARAVLLCYQHARTEDQGLGKGIYHLLATAVQFNF